MNTKNTSAVDMAIMEDCIRQATLAASSHNTQPWRFRICGETIELLADRYYSLPVNDPEDRELTISCGAALFNLRLAAASHGLGSLVETLPVASNPDLLARITILTGRAHDFADVDALGAAIKFRRTHRKAFLSQAVPQKTGESLAEAARLEGVTLVVLDPDQCRRQAVALIKEADGRLWSDPAWRVELTSWMNPRRQGEGFGIPGLALAASQLIIRTFDIGSGIAAQGEEILAGSPVLVLLGSKTDTAVDWLATGQALQRVLLRACADGLQASFLTQPMHFPELRKQLATLVPQAGVPQILLRAGFAPRELAPVVRRQLDQVLDIDWMGH